MDQKHGGYRKVVNDILSKGDGEIRKKCMGSCCPKNHVSSFKLGKLVETKQNEVKELVDKGHSFGVVTDVSAHPPVEEIPNEELRGDRSNVQGGLVLGGS